jgi:polysaccharide transporter, PST family
MTDTLKRNIFSLAGLQVGTYLVPLVTLPWLTRALGLEGYGQLGFATAVISYFILLTEWGFPLGATREVAVAKGDITARSEVFWNVMTAKFFFAFVSALVLSVLVLLVPKIHEVAILLLIAWGGVLAAAISPVFYLQGVEKMSLMAILNLAAKTASIPLVFIFVRDSNDVLAAALIQAICLLLASALNLISLARMSEIIWVQPRIERVFLMARSTSSLFLSNAAISLYTNSTTVILGFVASETAVGIFVAAYTLIKAALSLMAPVSQALFPRLSYLLEHERPRAERLLRRLFVLQTGFGFLVSLCVLVFSSFVVPLLLGDAFFKALPVLWGLAALPFLISASNVLGIQIMVPLGHNAAFSQILVVAGLVNVILAFPLGMLAGAIGAAVSMVIAELAVTVLMVFYIRANEPGVWSHLLLRKVYYE